MVETDNPARPRSACAKVGLKSSPDKIILSSWTKAGAEEYTLTESSLPQTNIVIALRLEAGLSSADEV